MNTPNDEGKPWWKIPFVFCAYVGSVLILAAVSFGFLHQFTTLPLWAEILIALPAGMLAFRLLMWLGISSDGPRR